jgi:ribosomal protein L24
MVIIEGINMKKKHKKPTRTTKGQTTELAFPLHISNVKLASEKAPKKQKAAKKKA